MKLSFVVRGEPRPKGSFRAVAVGVLRADNEHTAAWQGQVAAAARVAMSCSAPLEGPVSLSLRFYLQRPRTRQEQEATSKPDLDKLVRAAMDGFTSAAVYHDDRQVTCVTAEKAYAGGPHDPAGPQGAPRLEVVVL